MEARDCPRKKLRRYGRCLTLETTNRHGLAWLNPVSLAASKTQGVGVFNSATFEGTLSSTRSFRRAQVLPPIYFPDAYCLYRSAMLASRTSPV